MSPTIYNDPFTSIPDFLGDASLFTTPSDIESTNLDHALPPFSNLIGPARATPGYQYGLLQNVELLPAIDVSGHGLLSDEHPQGLNITGTYATMDNLNTPPPVPYTGNVGFDDQPRPITDLAEHRGNQTHDSRDHILIAPGPPQLEPELIDDEHVGHVPILDNVPGPSQRSPSPVPSRLWDEEDEDLKHLASQYLNSPASYVRDIRMRRHRFGGRKISIILEVDD